MKNISDFSENMKNGSKQWNFGFSGEVSEQFDQVTRKPDF